MRRENREARRVHVGTSMKEKELSDLFLDYEIKSSRWILLINLVWPVWLKNGATSLASAFFVRKTAKKFARYRLSVEAERQLKRFLSK